MIKVLLIAVVAIVVATLLGWIGWFSSLAESLYKTLYGKPMPNPHGGTTAHINAWLAFLPDDALTRSAITCGAIAALLAFIFMVNVLGIRYGKWKESRNQERESRIRTINSFHKT